MAAAVPSEGNLESHIQRTQVQAPTPFVSSPGKRPVGKRLAASPSPTPWSPEPSAFSPSARPASTVTAQPSATHGSVQRAGTPDSAAGLRALPAVGSGTITPPRTLSPAPGTFVESAVDSVGDAAKSSLSQASSRGVWRDGKSRGNHVGFSGVKPEFDDPGLQENLMVALEVSKPTMSKREKILLGSPRDPPSSPGKQVRVPMRVRACSVAVLVCHTRAR